MQRNSIIDSLAWPTLQQRRKNPTRNVLYVSPLACRHCFCVPIKANRKHIEPQKGQHTQLQHPNEDPAPGDSGSHVAGLPRLAVHLESRHTSSSYFPPLLLPSPSPPSSIHPSIHPTNQPTNQPTNLPTN